MSSGDGEGSVDYEAEVLPGLAPLAVHELSRLDGTSFPGPARDDAVPFLWRGPGAVPTDPLRTVTSLQRLLELPVPRPKALLGDQAFRQVVDSVSEVIETGGPFHGLRLEAAGSDSPVLRRLRDELSKALLLPDDPEQGDLRLRLRPSPDGAGWQLLVRTTPRPLSARSWRVVNLPGGLNACVAAAAWQLVGVAPQQRVLNAMCGSGTLLAERAAAGPAARLAGVDLDPDAVQAAAVNLAAAGLAVRSDLSGHEPTSDEVGRPAVELRLADATATPFEDASFDVVVADPPWGDAVGDVGDLPADYAALLREAARLVPVGGSALIITHALRAFEVALSEVDASWRLERTLRVFHGGHRPALHRLIRRG